ncbi:MAG: hypothetical protein B7Y00_06570 [Sphingomonadales bacterium 17-56-6]|nr:MAG: hypothetical protein B7Y00_06570 [Sphingomonadales bacterium 17-56-6]
MAAALVVWYKDAISSGLAGLVLAYALTSTEILVVLAQVCSQGNQALNSVERIKEYMETEQECLDPTRERPAPSYSWPRGGHIRFRSFATKHNSTLSPTMRDFDLQVDANRRLGIVGDIGGKESSLGLALIRVLLPSHGRIELDGVDIASLRLDVLRQLVTVVPREPTLFSGSLRENLDPDMVQDEDRLYELLESLHVPQLLPGLDLDDYLPEGLSRAQKQIICIARAMLRQYRYQQSLSPAFVGVRHSFNRSDCGPCPGGLRATIVPQRLRQQIGLQPRIALRQSQRPCVTKRRRAPPLGIDRT